MTISLGKIRWGKIGIFVEVIFNFSVEIGGFGITFGLTLLSRCNWKILQKKIFFFKICAFAREKIYNCYIKFFLSMWSLNFLYFDEQAYSVQEMAFLTISRTLYSYSSKYLIIKFSHLWKVVLKVEGSLQDKVHTICIDPINYYIRILSKPQSQIFNISIIVVEC